MPVINDVTDNDGDGVANQFDNCPVIPNPDQRDTDGDGEGDACDATIQGNDFDSDGIADNLDNCSTIPNMDQANQDGDQFGDVCDDTPNGTDNDGDGFPDIDDNCVFVSNPDQADSDGDGAGDLCETIDPDQDNDSVNNELDNCPSDPNSDQLDSDGDGLGDVCDPTPIADLDNDGVADSQDNCLNISNSDQTDTDGDGSGDACDATPEGPDSDGDGVPDIRDNCVAESNTNQLDSNSNGVGDACEIVEVQSVLDVLRGDGRFGLFVGAVEAAGLVVYLDDPDIAVTVFAVRDEDFFELSEAARELVLNDNSVRNLMLDTHIVDIFAYDQGLTISEIDAVGGVFTLNGDVLSAFGNTVFSETWFNEVEVLESDMLVGSSVIHVIDDVLLDFDLIIPPPVTIPTGNVDEVLADLGNVEIFRAALARDFGGVLDDQAWTFFMPTDAALSAAGILDLTAAEVTAHIISFDALDPQGLIAIGAVTFADGSVRAVEVDPEGNVVVDGNVASLIATGAAGAQVYSIDGVFQTF